ncbi:hypothetical protein ENBRE01_2345 [Enteropsectra breve]|nr:hypothetical protein ENBRE01_2345 [Enteropsectra breve]
MPTKSLDLVFHKDTETCIFSNVNMKSLATPLNIEREEPLAEEEQLYGKKKSMVVDYEPEEYIALKAVEQEPLVLSDIEGRSYAGKYQEMGDNSSMYFAFINMGGHLRVVPIDKWYNFTQRTSSALNADGLEKNMDILERKLNASAAIDFDDSTESNSEAQPDFEEIFDDDDGEEASVVVVREKRLTRSGRELQSLVENLDKSEENSEDKDGTKGADRDSDDEDATKRKKKDLKLDKEYLRRIFEKKQLGIKELLVELRTKFKLDDDEKKVIREFIHESCTFIMNAKTKEKIFKLKKTE